MRPTVLKTKKPALMSKKMPPVMNMERYQASALVQSAGALLKTVHGPPITMPPAERKRRMMLYRVPNPGEGVGPMQSVSEAASNIAVKKKVKNIPIPMKSLAGRPTPSHSAEAEPPIGGKLQVQSRILLDLTCKRRRTVVQELVNQGGWQSKEERHQIQKSERLASNLLKYPGQDRDIQRGFKDCLKTVQRIRCDRQEGICEVLGNGKHRLRQILNYGDEVLYRRVNQRCRLAEGGCQIAPERLEGIAILVLSIRSNRRHPR